MSNVFNPTIIFGLGRLGSETICKLRRELPADERASGNHVLVSVEVEDPSDVAQREIVARVGRSDAAEPGAGESPPPEMGSFRPDCAERSEDDDRVTVSVSTKMDDEDVARLRDLVVTEAWKLLRLGHLLEYSEAKSLSPPRFSVFVVADVGEPGVQQTLDELVRVVGRCLLIRYSHIFRPESSSCATPNFGIFPLLVLGGIRDETSRSRDGISRALRSLADTARRSSQWWSTGEGGASPQHNPIGRIALLDDQTTKYVLDRAEIISSLLGFLMMTLFCGNLGEARREDGVWPLARFFFGDPEDDRPKPTRAAPPLFATFGVATLDVAQHTVTSYVHNRLALSLIEGMRPDEPAPSAVTALRDVWDPAEIDRTLRGYGGDADSSTYQEDPERARSVLDEIEQRLSKLATELKSRCEPVEMTDSPERITNDKYSWPWYEGLAHTVKQTCREIEEQDLPRAGEEVDRRGLRLAHSRFAALRDRTDRWVWAEPQGWHRARQHLQELDRQAEKEARRAELQPDLPELPDTGPLKSALLHVRDLARSWPRRWRLWATCALAVFLLTVVFHFFPKWLYVRFIYENDVTAPVASGQVTGQVAGQVTGQVTDPRYEPPSWAANPMSFELPPSRTAARLVVDRPYVFLWLFLLFGALVGGYARHYHRKRKEEMDRAIWLLKNRMDDLVVGPGSSALQYFSKRVKFSRDLWIRKLLNRTIDQSREEIDRLNVIDRTLNQLAHHYREAQKRIGVRYVGPEEDEEDLSQIKGKLDDPLYRKLVSDETLTTLYDETVEDEAKRLEEHFQKEKNRSKPKVNGRSERQEWRENAPFADRGRLDGFIGSIIEEAGSEMRVLEQLLEDDRTDTHRDLGEAMQSFFADLAGKLSHAVELSTPEGSAQLTRLVLVPEDRAETFRELYGSIVQKAGLQQAHASRLEIVGSPDAERVHLLVGYSGLQIDDFRWLADSSAQGERRESSRVAKKTVSETIPAKQRPPEVKSD
jgi:hypothetical protein